MNSGNPWTGRTFPLTENEFAEFLRRSIGQARDGGPLLRCEAADAERVDRIRLRPLQVLCSEPMRTHWVYQRDLEPTRPQLREDVFPVVPGRLERDERLRGLPQELEQLGVSDRVLAEARRLQQDVPDFVHRCDDVPLSRDVDSDEAHSYPLNRRGKPGASEPISMPTLVNARTALRPPRDTVRALETGRGRPSHSRGRCLELNTATLSRDPSRQLYRCALTHNWRDTS